MMAVLQNMFVLAAVVGGVFCLVHGLYFTAREGRLSPWVTRGVALIALAAAGALVLAPGIGRSLTANCPASDNVFLSVGCSLAGLTGATPDADGAKAEERVHELSIATGRYGVMLAQVRDILGHPETSEQDDGQSAEGLPSVLDRIAAEQAVIVRELLADTRRACERMALPSDVRAFACETAGKVSSQFLVPVLPVLDDLLERDAALGALVIPWWDRVCASAPQPAAGEDPACPIE